MKLTNLQSLLSLSSIVAVQCQTNVDVVVVGAGLSGLSAARKLLDAGKTVRIVEARDRVGGLVANHKLKNGGVTELGAAFIGPTQDRVIALAQELGLQTFIEYNEGNNSVLIGERRIYYSPGELPDIDLQTSAQYAALIAEIDSKAATINPQKPWDHPSAETWDKMSLQDFRNSLLTKDDGREVFETAVESVFSVRSNEMSFLFALSYIAAAGNETNQGTFERLTGTNGGAQDSRMRGGTGQLPERLADKIGRNIISLSDPVRSISKQHGGDYLVTGAQSSYVAPRVIVAMSPPLAGRIEYSPALPHTRQEVQASFFRGSIGKANAIYDSPFWRELGLTGQVASTTGSVRVTFDASDAEGTYGALLGFIEADQMRALDNASDDEIVAKVTEDYVRYFGEKARNVQEWVVQTWDVDEFARGGPTAVAKVGTFRNTAPALREAVEGIHWAGTEGSDYWTGYMDGAIRSGERAAQEVLDSLNKGSRGAITQ